jgi:hypothetical protein
MSAFAPLMLECKHHGDTLRPARRHAEKCNSHFCALGKKNSPLGEIRSAHAGMQTSRRYAETGTEAHGEMQFAFLRIRKKELSIGRNSLRSCWNANITENANIAPCQPTGREIRGDRHGGTRRNAIRNCRVKKCIYSVCLRVHSLRESPCLKSGRHSVMKNRRLRPKLCTTFNP